MRIGNNIKEIRTKEKNLKQEDIARALGITTKAYSNIENNITDITLTRLYELADIFDVTPEYILNYQDRSTFTNHFNNYEGNKGVNIMYQGCSNLAKNIEEQIRKSKQEIKRLQDRSAGNN